MPTPRSAAFAAAAAHTAASDGPVGFLRRLASIPAMLRDSLTGRYVGLGRGRLMLLALAGLYIVSPIDLLPEALLTIPGLADDALVGVWLAASLLALSDDYLVWRGRPVASANSVPGVVVR